MGSDAPSSSRNCNSACRRSNWSARLCVLLVGLPALLQLLSGALATSQVADAGLSSLAAGLGLQSEAELQSIWHRPGLHTRRLLQQQLDNGTNNGTDTETRLLAVRGDRYDPIRAFRRYRGGYDIENSHYQASVIFTGVPAFVIALLWVLAGLLFLCFHPLILRTGTIKGTPKWRFYYWGPLLLAGIVALLSVVVLAFLVLESAKFHKNMDAVEATISDTGEQTVQAVFNVTSYVAVLSKLNTSSLGLSLDDSWRNTTRLTAINEEAERVENQVDDVVHVLHTIFKAMKVSLNAGAATQVLLLFLGLGLALLLWRFRSMRRWLLLLTLLCWILTTVVWLGSGLFIVANNVADDTCTAMSEYIQEPQSTTLDTILPCSRLQTRAFNALQQIRQGVDNVNSQVNAKLNEISNVTGETVPVICNSFGGPINISVTDTTDSCPPNTKPVGDLPAVSIVCSSVQTMDTLHHKFRFEVHSLFEC
eukprot:TRINITY_DN373_c0_g1_i1.p1 TRINITY_DN373_c0_g1~~TRINITY_DN373_c0_g1_i1.p1  ORF type:complete len:492 (-),score=43.69 TRINITY_DN373_c0_g1_i1:679-2112(-)